MPDQPPRRRSRSRSVLCVCSAITLVVVLCGVAAIPLFLIRGPRTDAEAVLKVHADLIEVALDPKHEGLWDLLSSRSRDCVEESLVPCKSPNMVGYGLGYWRMQPLRESVGLTTEDLAEMDARAFISELYRRMDEHDPERRREEIEWLRSLHVLRVEMDGDTATVACDGKPWAAMVNRTSWLPELAFRYVRENGEWRFDCMWGSGSFNPLEWKVEVYLMKCPSINMPEVVDAVVSIGPEGLGDEGRRALIRRIRTLFPSSPDEATIVIDAAPGLAWQTVVWTQDALREAGIEWITYAAATTVGPESGIRVNGVSVFDPIDSSPGPDTPTLSALARVLTIDMWPGTETELVVECANPETVEDIPWVLKTTFTNLCGRPIRAPSFRDGDGSVVLILTPLGLGPGREIRLEVSGKQSVEGPTSVLLGPGRKLTRLDAIPRRARGWCVRVEVLNAAGRWSTAYGPRLSTKGEDPSWPGTDGMDDKLDDCPPFGENPRWDAHVEQMKRREVTLGLTHAAGRDALRARDTLAKTIRTDQDPMLRLLAALVAGHIDAEAGKRLLRELSSQSASSRALSEAARRVQAAD
jgi:hypothetical protein